MTALRKLSVRARFHLVIALVTLSLAVLGLWGVVATHAGIRTVTTMFNQATEASAGVGAMREALSNLRRFEAAMIAVSVSNPTDVETYHKQWKAELARLDKDGSLPVPAARRSRPCWPRSASWSANTPP